MLNIDYSKDSLLSDYTKSILKERYMLPDEASPQDAFARAALAFADDEEHAQRMYNYVSNLWMMFATPILSNGGTKRGLPISCFLNYVDDSREGLNNHWNENTWLASSGGGVGGYWGDIRSDGSKTSSGSSSTGHVPFLKVVDSQMLAVSQGKTRRGSYAAYQDISHPEIEEFLLIRKPSGGDPNRKCLNLHHGVNITNDFMEIIEKCMIDPEYDDSWPLIDPHTGSTVKVVSAKRLWETILETRVATGEPYIHFIDTTNSERPESLKILNLLIKNSNLCSEIVLPVTDKRTAVCCLSSVNLEYYDEWKDTTMVRDLTRFLDNVLTYFINTAPDTMQKAKYSAWRERSIGIGAMGFYSYLQKKGVPFESAMAISLNRQMFKHLRDQSEIETTLLGRERGSAPDHVEAYSNSSTGVFEGSHRRNIHLLAVAPNASSSIICGNTSPSIEPYAANAFSQKTLNGTSTMKNKYLDKILKERTLDEDEYKRIWSSIVSHEGSVQHLDILTEDEKKVFKTAVELDQSWIVEHASHRQSFIDQSQSVNLFFPPDVNIEYLHKVHFEAWKKGLKTLYYLRSKSISRAENVSLKFDKFKYDDGECLSCEG